MMEKETLGQRSKGLGRGSKRPSSNTSPKSSGGGRTGKLAKREKDKRSEKS